MWVKKKIKNVLILLPAWARKIVQKVTISPNNGNGSFNVIRLFQLIYHIWFLVQCLLGEIRIVQSIFLHNLEDLLSDITVSGENVGIVGRNFNSSFCYVVSHFNCFHKLCCSQVVWILFPFSWWQSQPVTRQVQDVKELPGLWCDQV